MRKIKQLNENAKNFNNLMGKTFADKMSKKGITFDSIGFIVFDLITNENLAFFEYNNMELIEG